MHLKSVLHFFLIIIIIIIIIIHFSHDSTVEEGYTVLTRWAKTGAQ